jgi:CRP-like cAMP-binding protein
VVKRDPRVSTCLPPQKTLDESEDNLVGGSRVTVGDYFGVAETLFGLQRHSRARAVQPTVLLVLSKEHAEKLFDAEPSLKPPLVLHGTRRILWTYRSAGVSLFSRTLDTTLTDFASKSTTTWIEPYQVCNGL